MIATFELALGVTESCANLLEFLPGVSTTTFLLITVGCDARSSERLYVWLLTRPWLQKPTVLYLNPCLQADIARRGLQWRELIVLLFIPNHYLRVSDQPGVRRAGARSSARAVQMAAT
ncbi:MAG: DUF454 family protein [Chloroflexi bacterium]|nr:MAG: DUF454 family protein [Chloroflexota bacterium]